MSLIFEVSSATDRSRCRRLLNSCRSWSFRAVVLAAKTFFRFSHAPFGVCASRTQLSRCSPTHDARRLFPRREVPVCRFGCCVVCSIDIAPVAVPEQVLVHLVRPRCVVRSVELLCRKRARHSSVHCSSCSVSSSRYVGCREVLNPRALIPCEECRAEANEDRKQRERRNAQV